MPAGVVAPLTEAAGPRAGTAAVVVVAAVAVVVVVVAVAVVAGRSAAAVAAAVAADPSAAAVTAGREAADTADAPSNHSHGRMAAVSGAAPAILYRLLPAPPGGAGRI